MGKFLVLAIFMATSYGWADCSPEQTNENFILKVDYFVFKNMEDVQTRYQEVYQSGRRLRNRLYQNSDQTYAVNKIKGAQKVPASFINNLSQQLEMILQRRYGEYLFYPDLGHAHLMIPTIDYKNSEAELNLTDKLSSPNLVLLYHTAELIEMKEDFKGSLKTDPWLQWRYYSRNVISPINDSKNLAVLMSNEENYNTVRSLPGYSEVGRVYFSASERGCLPLSTGTQNIFYDINFD